MGRRYRLCRSKLLIASLKAGKDKLFKLNYLKEAPLFFFA
jgi:hypothetical protein